MNIFFCNKKGKLIVIVSNREILLMVNLCVSLANAYITPLAPSPDDIKAETTPVPQAVAPTGKKGAKGGEQPAAATAAASEGSAGSSLTTIKNDDLKAALEVNYFDEIKSSSHFILRHVNMQ